VERILEQKNEGNDSPKQTVYITRSEAKLALCVFAHLRNIMVAIGMDRGGIIAPLDMDQADLLLCSASLRSLMFDYNVSVPPLIELLEKFSPNCLIPCIETHVNMFFLSDFFGERPHVSDFLIKIICDTFGTKNEGVDKINQQDTFLLTYMSGKGFKSLMEQKNKWLPTIYEYPDGGVGISGTSDGIVPSQLVTFTRKLIPLREWRNQRIGLLKTTNITRRNIVCYTANELGGVHYNSKRLPPQEERNAFHLLTEAYDWEDQAVNHAGLICTALIAVELMLCEDVRSLIPALEEFLLKRDETLRVRFEKNIKE
jgi:hypothetical protein